MNLPMKLDAFACSQTGWCSTCSIARCSKNSQLHILPGPCDSQIFRQSLQESLQILGKSRPPAITGGHFPSHPLIGIDSDRPTKTRQLTSVGDTWGLFLIGSTGVYHMKSC